MIYEIKRGGTVVLAIRANGKQHRAVMIEDRGQMEFTLPEPVTFLQGDTVEVFGQTYKLNRDENLLLRHDKAGYTYSLEFEALYYDLGKWELKGYDRNNELKEPEVFLMCDANTLMDLIVANANRNSPGWTKGYVEPTEVMMYTYNAAKLLTVLQDIADKNHTEFWCVGKQINLSRNQPESGLVWEFGINNELYELHRNRTDNPRINRLTVLGGSRNIPLDYGFKRLQPTGGNPLSVPATGDIIEHTVTFENVYPSRIGTVTAVLEDNEFSDSSIDFNLNNYKATVPAKVAFTTGQLAGFMFSVSEDGYNHDTKTITLNYINDDPAYPPGVPNPLIKPAVGDKYVLLDIYLPEEYKTAQENKLKGLGESYLEDYNVSRHDWGCRVKPKYVIEEEVEIVLGSIVNIKHAALGVDHNIRVSGYVRDLQEPYQYDVSLSNIITISELVRQRNATDQLSSTITRSGLSDGSVKSDDTLQSVSQRGSTTDRIITVAGSRNNRLLTLPNNPPLPEDIKPGETYIYTGAGSGGVPPAPIEADNGFASVFEITEDYTINWLTGMSRDDTGADTDKTWFDRFGSTVFITRLFYDGAASLWRDESNQVDLTYSGNSISTLQFTSVRGLTKIIITGRGGGTPVGIWEAMGPWEQGEYERSQYVSAPSTEDISVLSFYFKRGAATYFSTIPPRADPEHWMEMPMVPGPVGPDGSIIHAGSGSPSAELGRDGDFYFNDTSGVFIGPKEEGEWPSTGKSLLGPQGKSIEMGVTPTHIVWRVVGDSSWINLMARSETKGDKGDAAVISGATAVIDSGTGTPSVTVTPAGSDQNRSFHFSFSNLKGAKGDSFTVNAVGPRAGRDEYNGRAEGFSYLATDEGLIYFRVGAAGNWSDGSPFGRGKDADIEYGTTAGTVAEGNDDRINNGQIAFEEMGTIADSKVDKVTGKGLSTNDYTTSEKNKLAAIAAGADVSVNADWNASSGKAQILNKPSLDFIPTSQKGAAGGVATLDADQNIIMSQIPDVILGQLKYGGSFNAAGIITPSAYFSDISEVTSINNVIGEEFIGFYFIASHSGFEPAGSGIDDIETGDWLIVNSSTSVSTSWEKIDNTDAVSLVNGKKGNVVLSAADVGAIEPGTGGSQVRTNTALDARYAPLTALGRFAGQVNITAAHTFLAANAGKLHAKDGSGTIALTLPVTDGIPTDSYFDLDMTDGEISITLGSGVTLKRLGSGNLTAQGGYTFVVTGENNWRLIGEAAV